MTEANLRVVEAPIPSRADGEVLGATTGSRAGGRAKCDYVLVNRIRIHGMVVLDWSEHYGEAIAALLRHVEAGEIKYRESIVGGLDNAPRGLVALLNGENFGKQIVRLG